MFIGESGGKGDASAVVPMANMSSVLATVISVDMRMQRWTARGIVAVAWGAILADMGPSQS